MKKVPVKLTLLATAAAILLLVLVLMVRWSFPAGPPLSVCRSELILLHDGFSLHARFEFVFGRTAGSVAINGGGRGESGPYVIDRRISFDYETLPGRYILRSTAIRPYRGDTAAAAGVSHHLPAFFTAPQASLPLNLGQDAYRHPVLVLSGTPLFWCVDTGKGRK